jgi:hypothetical protein
MFVFTIDVELTPHLRRWWHWQALVIVGEVVMLARMVLALATRACNRDAGRVVAHGAGNQGQVRRVGARAATSTAQGTVGGHLAGARGHQGSRIHAVGGV